jgi:hypothetical protein
LAPVGAAETVHLRIDKPDTDKDNSRPSMFIESVAT